MSLRDEQLDVLKVGDKSYDYYRIADLEGVDHLPYSLKVLVENLVRNIDGANITDEQVRELLAWDPAADPSHEIQFTPSRVVMQDFTGVPCVVDLATMRDAVKSLGGDPEVINPQVQSDMIIDHSVQIDAYGVENAVEINMDIEYQRNGERYQFLRWGQQAFENFRVVPPGTGIIHQVNIEYLAQVVMRKELSKGTTLAYLDSCVGTDSHTTTVNGLGVLGWGVGGIEAEAAMLGQPISMLVPRVVGFKLTGSIPEGVTATDVVLTITDLLRRHGVVGKFVEFYGEGIASVPLANRATIGNMSPEFGSTCGIFPIDEVTLDYLRLTGRSEEQVALVEAYAKANKLWHDVNDPNFVEPSYSEYLELDLSTVVPSIAGPKRPQDRIELSHAKTTFEQTLPGYITEKTNGNPVPVSTDFRGDFELTNGDVAIASITSCTNTSNPSVMIAAGLIARNAVAKGLKPKPWVKTSLAPGSQVVADYLKQAGLQDDLDRLGYELVGFGCATCIGNSGPLLPEISEAINANDLTVTAVLSGNRNFEGRISPDVKMNYLASPPLVIAYALAGTMDFDFEHEALGKDPEGNDVYLKDIWPTNAEVEQVVSGNVSREMFLNDYASVFEGDSRWKGLDVPEGELFAWNPESTYVRKQTFFDGMSATPAPVEDIRDARVLALLGDSVTTDHISPAGAFKASSPAGKYLVEHGVEPKNFNSYGSRRGNHEVMVRGTFGNIRLRNMLLASVGEEVRPGGYTYDFLAMKPTTIYEASRDYIDNGVPLVVLGGKEYGTGSSRDWAAKGTAMLGVKAVIVESFERIHRSNLIGMGVLPLQFPEGESAESLGLDGTETYSITGITELNNGITPKSVHVEATHKDGSKTEFEAVVRIDTPGEADYYRNGGILQYVLRNLMK
ncbi:aconitate hydratase [Bifidobacterium animalis subsp. animalis MCC 1489]|uniref:Aconitate hydratase n=1 Tax=Bifidobacterium animalis subsp. animalis IM386 TaxID=1402194 RepID=A0AAV2W089_9BIFI|nr:aconitate hydratase AcnA [Bifidobacterium animalis]AFI63324.1 aconitate hydratase [Bifidobacterium animalis subsp. animalis ATCC 25527]AYN23954.1 aconitate hydratase [Bifidobacterium animalis subsp. animalis]KFI44645.1 aconitate hydratase [Bifidobacterium animalis subsp. animalis]KOA62173.1 aconitate hydratase [Bifidobacterium animalis subsp. animalis MCC 0499]KOA62947.1 aconitate hydratase [Bifidobacterium animalis subsp. animalis MCC 1489]